MDKMADQLDPVTSPIVYTADQMAQRAILGAGIGGVAGLLTRHPQMGLGIGLGLGALEGAMRAKHKRQLLMAQLGFKTAGQLALSRLER